MKSIPYEVNTFINLNSRYLLNRYNTSNYQCLMKPMRRRVWASQLIHALDEILYVRLETDKYV